MISDLLATTHEQSRRRIRPEGDSDARILACAELARSGKSEREIASKLGVPRSTVGRWLRKVYA